MGKYTPGPLKVIGNGIFASGYTDTYDAPIISRIGTAHDTVTMDGDGREWACHGTPEANARLWATAPDMLEALEGLVSAIEDYLAALPDTTYADHTLIANCLSAARAVIAKTRREG